MTLRAPLSRWTAAFGTGAKAPCRLDHDLCAEVIPGQISGLGFREYRDLRVVYADDSFAGLDLTRKAAVHGVVLQEVGKGVRISEIIDPDELEPKVTLVRGAKRRAAHASKSVDGDPGVHLILLVGRRSVSNQTLSATPSLAHPRAPGSCLWERRKTWRVLPRCLERRLLPDVGHKPFTT